MQTPSRFTSRDQMMLEIRAMIVGAIIGAWIIAIMAVVL